MLVEEDNDERKNGHHRVILIVTCITTDGTGGSELVLHDFKAAEGVGSSSPPVTGPAPGDPPDKVSPMEPSLQHPPLLCRLCALSIIIVRGIIVRILAPVEQTANLGILAPQSST